MRAATACARSASGAKDAGISAATTPGSQSAIVVSTSAPPLSAVMAVSLSGATAADAGHGREGGAPRSPAGLSVTTSHGISERQHHEQQRQQENFAHARRLLSALRGRFAP
ncbi:MAG: hypothetical protein ACLUNO_08360 [Oscillospiraceae bacterium]